MRYLILIHSDETQFPKLPEAEIQSIMKEYRAVTEEMKAAGALISFDRLRPTSTATTVRVRDGKPLITDGPFAETKEQLGGFYLVEVKDLDEAIAWAAKIPSARFGSIEVRPVWS